MVNASKEKLVESIREWRKSGGLYNGYYCSFRSETLLEKCKQKFALSIIPRKLCALKTFNHNKRKNFLRAHTWSHVLHRSHTPAKVTLSEANGISETKRAIDVVAVIEANTELSVNSEGG